LSRGLARLQVWGLMRVPNPARGMMVFKGYLLGNNEVCWSLF
jgi:hypothetical protein